MLGLTKLLAAVSTLADALRELAGTLTQANAALRERLALDAPTPMLPAPEAEQLPEPAGTGSGKRGRKAE